MMPTWTDDPVRDAEAYSDYLEDEEKDLPVCDRCGERITEDHYYQIDGDIWCPDCVDRCRVWI